MQLTVAQIIDLLGGPAAASKLTGRGATAPYNWISRGRIPAELFLKMSAELAKLGVVAPPPQAWGMEIETREVA